jgi:hypothetical protein
MKQKQRTASLTIRLTPETKEDMSKYAADNKLTITQVLEKGFNLLQDKISP